MPVYVLGFMGMTRRISQNIDPTFHTMLLIAAVGVAIIGVGILCRLFSSTSVSVTATRTATLRDPWGGRTLEWATSSPPPFYNFAEVPDVQSRDEWWDMKEKGTAHKRPAKYEEIHMPKTRQQV